MEGTIWLSDNTAKQVELVKIHIDTPYYVGDVEAICLPNALYDLLIGNIKGVRKPKDPDHLWKVAGGNKKEENLKEVNKKEDTRKEDNRKEDIRKEDNRKEDNLKEDNRKQDNQKEDNQKEDNQKEDNWKEDNWKEDNQKEDNQKAAGCDIRKEDFLKMQDEYVTLKCP